MTTTYILVLLLGVVVFAVPSTASYIQEDDSPYQAEMLEAGMPRKYRPFYPSPIPAAAPTEDPDIPQSPEESPEPPVGAPDMSKWPESPKPPVGAPDVSEPPPPSGAPDHPQQQQQHHHHHHHDHNEHEPNSQASSSNNVDGNHLEGVPQD